MVKHVKTQVMNWTLNIRNISFKTTINNKVLRNDDIWGWEWGSGGKEKDESRKQSLSSIFKSQDVHRQNKMPIYIVRPIL